MRASVADSMYFRGLTAEDRQKDRSEILETRLEDLKALAQPIADVMSQNYLCTIGTETALTRDKALFEEIKYVH